MGLDMMLYRRQFLRTDEAWKNTDKVTLIRNGESVVLINPKYLTEEVAYWRKANHIHKWFVDNVQGGVDDCKEYEISVNQLRELVGLCKAVLNVPEDAENILPPQSGFFFGSTAIDDYYYEDLRSTIDQLEKVLADDPDNWQYQYFYRASW